jgi:hypothetical protein
VEKPVENLWKSIDLPCAKQEAASRLKSGFPLFVTLWAFEKASMLEAEANRKGFLSFPFQSSRQKPIDRLREGKQGSKQHRKGKAIFLGFCESSGSFHTFPILREDHQERKADKRRKLLRKASQDVKKRKKDSRTEKRLFPLHPRERKGKRKRRRRSWRFAGKGL